MGGDRDQSNQLSRIRLSSAAIQATRAEFSRLTHRPDRAGERQNQWEARAVWRAKAAASVDSACEPKVVAKELKRKQQWLLANNNNNNIKVQCSRLAQAERVACPWSDFARAGRGGGHNQGSSHLRAAANEGLATVWPSASLRNNTEQRA